MNADEVEVGDLVCSARRCRLSPAWALRWHNPRLHEPGYTKTWLACDEHVERLTGFLDERGFTFDQVPIAERDSPASLVARDGAAGGAAAGPGN